ncbi:MAG TPA: dihydroorotase, partial [Thermomicrobiales bacterium]|nr:dihydroorotase [Thermomicrobiales bacterium]
LDHVHGVQEIDATGKIVSPAWIDIHVHLRQPGFDEKETVKTGTEAAVAGGFASIACMPNTKPALDSPEVLRELAAVVEREGVARVYPIATITRGRTGGEAVDFDALAEAGAIGFSDDGDTTANSLIMRHALEASVRLNRPVMVHCEDKALAAGAMNEGIVSTVLGIPGIPAIAEEIIIARDLMIAELTGGWLHVCHVSTGRGAELIAEAKKRGVRVTVEVMPHHIVMSDDWVAGDRTLHNTEEEAGANGHPADPNTKVNPPLRPVADTEMLLKAIQDGVFDCFGTDHAPHAAPEKSGSYESAAFGLSGLEFAFPSTYALVRAGHISLNDLIRLWTVEPAKILRSDLGTLSVGSPADITVFDPDLAWEVTPAALRTKSANTPLLGMTLRGRSILTLVNGEARHHV